MNETLGSERAYRRITANIADVGEARATDRLRAGERFDEVRARHKARVGRRPANPVKEEGEIWRYLTVDQSW